MARPWSVSQTPHCLVCPVLPGKQARSSDRRSAYFSKGRNGAQGHCCWAAVRFGPGRLAARGWPSSHSWIPGLKSIVLGPGGKVTENVSSRLCLSARRSAAHGQPGEERGAWGLLPRGRWGRTGVQAPACGLAFRGGGPGGEATQSPPRPLAHPSGGGWGAGRGGEGIAEAGGRSGRKLGSAWEGDPSGSRWPGHGDGMM